IPLQSAYCGAKHAIQGFNESLRCELLQENSGIHVTMVQMPALNTPQFETVLTRLPRHPRPVAPVFQPEVAAEAIAWAARNRRREVWVGGGPARAAGTRRTRSPPLSDYAFLSDCHSSALVSREGSIDWCCMPRFDAGAAFARLLDWERGGHCSIEPLDGGKFAGRSYLDGTLVLETTVRAGGAEATSVDCLTLRLGGALDPHRQLIRIVEGGRAEMRFRLTVAPRFDYG